MEQMKKEVFQVQVLFRWILHHLSMKMKVLRIHLILRCVLQVPLVKKVHKKNQMCIK